MTGEFDSRDAAVTNAAMTPQLHRELWSSWAGVLRAYAAVHSLGRVNHAVIEVSDDRILMRYGARSMEFDPSSMREDGEAPVPFCLTVNGRAIVGDTEDEMDLVAERLCREIIAV